MHIIRKPYRGILKKRYLPTTIEDFVCPDDMPSISPQQLKAKIFGQAKERTNREIIARIIALFKHYEITEIDNPGSWKVLALQLIFNHVDCFQSEKVNQGRKRIKNLDDIQFLSDLERAYNETKSVTGACEHLAKMLRYKKNYNGRNREMTEKNDRKSKAETLARRFRRLMKIELLDYGWKTFVENNHNKNVSLKHWFKEINFPISE